MRLFENDSILNRGLEILLMWYCFFRMSCLLLSFTFDYFPISIIYMNLEGKCQLILLSRYFVRLSFLRNTEELGKHQLER